jgi:two-component system phosphate regulon response regulator PhoB
MAGILILCDDADALVRLDLHLREVGHETSLAANVAQVREVVGRSTPDLLLVEVTGGTPALFAALRADPATRRLPILVCSARCAEEDRIAAFEAGVDDFVAKPYSMRELTLRVRAIVRHPRAHASAEERSRCVGPIRLDLDAHRAFVDGREIVLTPMEFRLLAALATNVGRVHGRRELLLEVWRSDDADPRTVDTHVKRIREKLGPAASLLSSVRGVGYRLDDVERVNEP